MKWAVWFALLLLMALISPGLAQEAKSEAGASGYLAFVALGEQSADIVVADLATSKVLDLSNNVVLSAHPTWSGDGSRLAFNNAFADAAGNFTDIEIFVMDANGLNPRNISNHPALDVSPDWSPVSNEIVFQSNRDGGTDLYIVDADSGETRRITSDGLPKNRPDWSPDGTQIVYWQIEGDEVTLQILDLASGSTRPLVDSGQNLWPAWSPDGTQIAVHDESGGQAQIYLVDVETGARQLISDGTAKDLRPEWSPNGSQIAFYSDRAGEMALFVMDADGSNITLFSEDIGPDLSAAWRPMAPAINFAANPNLGLSAVRVNADSVDVSDQSLLGTGIRRLYAPSQTYYEEPVHIRLEIQLDDPDIVPQGEPVAELVDEGAIDVYRIMGAELEGQDLDDFTLLPEKGYLLQIQEDDVNFWDWRLIPKGRESVGRKYLLVNIYLPDVDDDGLVTKAIQESILLEFEITAAAIDEPAASETVSSSNDVEIVYNGDVADLNMPGEEPLQGLTVYNNNRDLLAITFTQSVDFAAIRVASERADYALLQTFPALAAFQDGGLPASYCVFYERDDDAANPVRPFACQTQDQLGLRLNPGDVFWYNSQTNALSDIIIRQDGESYYCPAGLDRCDF